MDNYITITDMLIDSHVDPVVELRSGEVMNLSIAQQKFAPDTEVRYGVLRWGKWYRLGEYDA